MKQFVGTQSVVLRRVALLGAALLIAVLSCGREPTAPEASEPGAVRWAHALAFQPLFPKVLQQVSGASSVVSFDHVHIVLRRVDGSVALDTVVAFPVGSDEITVSMNVRLAQSAPTTGEPMALTLDYRSAADVSVFHGGPVTVIVSPTVPGAGPPPPSTVTIPLTYTGPGASATSVRISPRTVTVSTGATFNFSAQALDANGIVVPNTPIVFSTQNAVLATVGVATGAGTAGLLRGTVGIVAQLLTGPTDVATVAIVPPAATLALLSGGSQTGPVNLPLPNPVVVRATAGDGVGVAGVSVTFAVITGGGSVSSATVTTDANGNAQNSWRLGSVVGAQTLTVTSAGLSGSPLTVSATARAVDPVRLVFSVQPPTSSAAGSVLAPAIMVNAVDATGAVTPAFTGPITLALSAGSLATATLAGTMTVNAAAGVAIFGDLRLNQLGTHTLVATAPSLVGATSNSFAIVAGAAYRMAFQGYPVAGAVAGTPLDPVTVAVRDSLNNPVTSFTGVITLAIGTAANTVITGTTSVNAVAGIATFSDLRLTTAGSYALVARSTGLVTTTGPSFNVTPGLASAFALLSGGGQTAVGGVTLAQSITVQVTDAFGNAVVGAGRAVTFAIAAGGGSVTPTSTTTNASGQASTTWTLGVVAGAQSITASSAGLGALTVGATATTPVGPTLTISGGNGQSRFAGALLPTPLRVRVINALAAAMPGVTVNWAAATGGGSVSTPTSVTDTSGVATIVWTLGATPGSQAATATVAGVAGSPATFTANAIPFAFANLAAGFAQTCGVTAGGVAFCWGDNSIGELGDGTLTNRLTPTPVTGGLAFSSLAANDGFTCGLTTGGAAYCWGQNNLAELGDGTTTDRLIPTPVVGGLVFVSLTAGDTFACGVTAAGAAYCWGYNDRGQVGDGSIAQRLTPTPVAGGLMFVRLTAGTYHACGITTAGPTYCWSYNAFGQLGDGTTTGRLTPTLVTGGLVFTSLAAGYAHTCGRTAAGAGYCWGDNANGEVGDGTTSNRSAPTPVAGGVVFASLAASNLHSCGLTAAGAAYCWGQNDVGQLGDGTTTERYTPTLVAGGVVFSSLTAGYKFTCGRTSAGAAYCWGLNASGQLGDGTTTNRAVPTLVKP